MSMDPGFYTKRPEISEETKKQRFRQSLITFIVLAVVVVCALGALAWIFFNLPAFAVGAMGIVLILGGWLILSATEFDSDIGGIVILLGFVFFVKAIAVSLWVI